MYIYIYIVYDIINIYNIIPSIPQANQSPPWTQESATASKKFSDLQLRLPPIVAHFARLGKLEKFEVNETPSKEISVMIPEMVGLVEGKTRENG